MSKTADPVLREGASPRELGRTLRQVRRTQGLSRAEVARSAGLTRRELAAYERGRSDVPDSDLWCLAGSCGVEVAEILPERARLTIGPGIVDFFSMPQAADPFAPPPALDALTAGMPATIGRATHGNGNGSRNGHDVVPIAWATQDHTPGTTTGDDGPDARTGAAWRVGGISRATAMADDRAPALRRVDARWALADRDAPGDVTIEATVDFIAGAGFGILFRATVDDHERVCGYSFDTDPLAGGGGYLVRQWDDNRQHGRPLARASVSDPSRLYGRHAIRVTLMGDHLTATVDGDRVLTVPGLSSASIGLGREPSLGRGIGVQAWATTELTVDTFRVLPA